MKVGILYPSSKAHPGISMDYIKGVRAFLTLQDLDKVVTIVSESIGLGGEEKEVYQKAEKLLVMEDADVLVAYIDLRVFPLLEPLLYTSGKLVIIVNPGANYPDNWISQPNIIFLTLQHAFLCSLSGLLPKAVDNMQAALATTFYDCGYLHSAAMVKSYVHSGGAIGFNYVNNQRYDDNFNISELADYLTTNEKVRKLLCVFDELPATLFYDRLNSFERAGDLHLFVSPMMLQQKALEKQGDGFKFSIQGYVPWHASLQSESNTLFMNNAGSQLNKEPGIFSMLGWETGMILAEIAKNCKDQLTDGVHIVETLANIKMQGPRGALKLDPQTNYLVAPVIKCSIKKNTNNMEMEQIGIPETEWAAFTETQTNGVTSGWTNTYLCY